MILTGFLVRLVGGSLYNEGRVEVNYNGEWGTVCDDGWDDTDAGVVCRQLGFGSSGTAIGSAGFGQGSGSIWLNSVACTGGESQLASCVHREIGITRSCSHYEIAAVTCINAPGNVIDSASSHIQFLFEISKIYPLTDSLSINGERFISGKFPMTVYEGIHLVNTTK